METIHIAIEPSHLHKMKSVACRVMVVRCSRKKPPHLVRASTVVIADGAEMLGDVVAEDLTVNGRVKGGINANRVRLGGTGVVEGDISHQTLAMEERARFEGRARRNEKAIDAQSFVHEKRPGDQGTKSRQ